MCRGEERTVKEGMKEGRGLEMGKAVCNREKEEGKEGV